MRRQGPTGNTDSLGRQNASDMAWRLFTVTMFDTSILATNARLDLNASFSRFVTFLDRRNVTPHPNQTGEVDGGFWANDFPAWSAVAG